MTNEMIRNLPNNGLDGSHRRCDAKTCIRYTDLGAHTGCGQADGASGTGLGGLGSPLRAPADAAAARWHGTVDIPVVLSPAYLARTPPDLAKVR